MKDTTQWRPKPGGTMDADTQMGHTDRARRTIRRIAALSAGAGVLVAPIASEVRVARALRPPTERWQQAPIAPRRSTLLGISFRPRQVDALGLDARLTLRTLLAYPFQLIRLG